MADTFVKIATVTVGSGGSSEINFSSIPSTYTDLCLFVSGRSTAAVNSVQIGAYLNGGSYPGTGSSNKNLIANGSTVSSSSNVDYLIFGDVTGTSATSSTFSNVQVYLTNYAGSTAKSMSTDSVTENNGTTVTTALYANGTTNTAAISAIKMNLGAGNFAEYSTATLYGISKT
jgi:hypothetical protein